jgi:prolipoprotein diacylglyceryl transferase
MDAAAPSLLVAQAIGRVGNYFNQELFGKPTMLPWGLRIDPSHRPSGYAAYSTFQPTFLYEIVWNLALAGVLMWLGRSRRVRAPGLFALYVAGYSGFRMFEESLRIDYSNHILGFRLNYYLAAILCLAGVVWFVAIQFQWSLRSRRVRRGAGLLGASWILVWAGGCGSSVRPPHRPNLPVSVATPSAPVGTWLAENPAARPDRAPKALRLIT